MKLGRPLAYQPCALEVGPDHFRRRWRKLSVQDVQKALRGDACRLSWVTLREDAFVIASERVQSILPSVCAGGNKGLKNGQRHGFCLVLAVFQGSSHRRKVRKASLLRKRPISSSGLTPGSRRRNNFKIKRLPNTTELLLCSAFTIEGSRGPRRAPEMFLKAGVTDASSSPGATL